MGGEAEVVEQAALGLDHVLPPLAVDGEELVAAIAHGPVAGVVKRDLHVEDEVGAGQVLVPVGELPELRPGVHGERAGLAHGHGRERRDVEARDPQGRLHHPLAHVVAPQAGALEVEVAGHPGGAEVAHDRLQVADGRAHVHELLRVGHRRTGVLSHQIGGVRLVGVRLDAAARRVLLHRAAGPAARVGLALGGRGVLVTFEDAVGGRLGAARGEQQSQAQRRERAGRTRTIIAPHGWASFGGEEGGGANRRIHITGGKIANASGEVVTSCLPTRHTAAPARGASRPAGSPSGRVSQGAAE